MSKKQWIVNPGANLVSECAKVGRFLEYDYRLSIKNAEVPSSFEENLLPTGRRFVIIGARSVPMATAKSVFLCLRLAGAESVVVKTATEDEGLLVKNVLDNWTPDGVKTKIFSVGSDKLGDYPEWVESLENATDIVVFGGEDTAKSFEELDSKDRHVYIHGPKFSFSIVDAKTLTMVDLMDICSDFANFYGEGCLSPKFCVIVGDIGANWYHEASIIMRAEYGDRIEGFRSKMTLAKKSQLVQEMTSSNIIEKFVRLETLENDEKLLSSLYGDIRFINIKSLKELWPFMDKWKNRISSVSSSDNEEAINLLQKFGVVRVCNFGEMQFPEFDEQFDSVDDFDIYMQ